MIVRVKGIHRVRAKGRDYYYHRATKTRIMAPPNSAAFISEVRRLDDHVRQPSKMVAKSERRNSYRAGTWGALVAAYRGSPEWTQLAPRTKRDYSKVLDYLAAIDDMPAAQITSAFCMQARDRAYQQHKRRFANYVLHMLSVVLGWGKPRGHVAENAAIGLPKIPRPKDAPDANRPWSAAECEAVLSAAVGGLRVAIALAMFAGTRREDTVRIGWTAYDGQHIEWRQGKTGDAVWLPVDLRLKAILDEAPRVATTIVTGASGRPWRPATLDKEFHALVRRLQAVGLVRSGLTFHGLRTTAATDLADLGSDVYAIQARLGHKSANMALHYSRAHSRKRAATAAVVALEKRKL